jgi:hypothetical protein
MITTQQPITLQGEDWFTVDPDDRYNFVGDTIRNPKGYVHAAIFVGVGLPHNTGTIMLVSEDGNSEAFENIQSGSFIPCKCVRVHASGTTVTGIKAIIQKSELQVK